MATQHTILTPNLTSVDDNGDNTATLVIEPLHTGYGMTLGNSLRRVLLSSIAGAAVIAVKIEGATHEFTTVPGVQEDIVDIILNLKRVRLNVFVDDKPVLLRISKKGSGPVTSGDIEKSADVEIVNPDLVIANLDDKASFSADILVESGRGYVTVEERQEKVPSDMITIDALYSPVTRVRYKVENTRVGQITNLDKLVLTVTTDGTISPEDAFEEANAILRAQYDTLAGQTTVVTAQAQKPVIEEAPVATEPSELMTPIEDLGLSARTTNALINNDIHNVNDLVNLTDADLKELKGFGSKALDEVQNKISELSL